MYVRCCKICVIYSKVNFITNIINSTKIHTIYFYNNKYTFINMDTTFITKHTNFIKINTNPMMGPKCSPLCNMWGALDNAFVLLVYKPMPIGLWALDYNLLTLHITLQFVQHSYVRTEPLGDQRRPWPLPTQKKGSRLIGLYSYNFWASTKIIFGPFQQKFCPKQNNQNYPAKITTK